MSKLANKRSHAQKCSQLSRNNEQLGIKHGLRINPTL